MVTEKTYKVRNIENMKDLLTQSVQLFGQKNAFLVRDNQNDYSGISYLQFSKDIDALGTALLDMGLMDKNIALIGENRYEWCVTYLATVNGVGVTVPLDKELPVHEIENLLRTSKSTALVFSGKLGEDIKKITSAVPMVKYFISMDEQNEENGFLSLKSLIQKGNNLIKDGNTSFVEKKIDSKKMSILLFTSGTTGLAKGVMLSHENICSNIMSVSSMVKIESSDTALSILPLHHTYECTCGFLTMIYNGATIAFCEGLRHIGKNLKEVKPSVLILVPLLLENMYKKIWESVSKKRSTSILLKTFLVISGVLRSVTRTDIRRKLFKQVHNNFGGQLRLIITGAAAVDPDVSIGLNRMGVEVLQGYGLTECSPLVAGNRVYANKYKSVGQCMPGVDIRIENPDKDGIGEIVVRGSNVMLGYYENEEATSKCLRGEWFYTGDLGYLDKEGYLFITGRLKNVIVTKNGKNVFPEEVESYINKSPYILESLVFGDFDEESGETTVRAQIVPNFETIKEKLKVTLPTKEDIQKILADVVKNANKSMPLYKHIKDFSIRDSEFVKTTTKKIKRYMEKNEDNSKKDNSISS